MQFRGRRISGPNLIFLFAADSSEIMPQIRRFGICRFEIFRSVRSFGISQEETDQPFPQLRRSGSSSRRQSLIADGGSDTMTDIRTLQWVLG